MKNLIRKCFTKIICVPLMLVTLFAASACGEKALNKASDRLPLPTGEYEEQIPGLQSVFELTQSQRTLYEEFIKTCDINLFKGKSPVDVVQVYIECGLEGYWEAEYECFHKDIKDTMTKDEFYVQAMTDAQNGDLRSRREWANLWFPYLKDGTFVEEGKDTGFIYFKVKDMTDGDFNTTVTSDMRIPMKKSGNGIWLVQSVSLFETSDE